MLPTIIAGRSTTMRSRIVVLRHALFECLHTAIVSPHLLPPCLLAAANRPLYVVRKGSWNVLTLLAWVSKNKRVKALVNVTKKSVSSDLRGSLIFDAGLVQEAGPLVQKVSGRQVLGAQIDYDCPNSVDDSCGQVIGLNCVVVAWQSPLLLCAVKLLLPIAMKLLLVLELAGTDNED